MHPEIRAALARADTLPPDRPGPAFREAWHAQAFALAVEFAAEGHFTWPEWAETLAAALREQPPSDDPEDAYYRAWLAALERLSIAKGLIDKEWGG